MKALIVPDPGDRAGPLRAGGVVGEPGDDDVDQLVVGAAGVAVDADGAVLAGLDRVQPQPGGDLADDHRVLVAFVLGVGEDVGEQFALAELRERPPERFDAAGPAGDVRSAGEVVGGRRGVEADGLERPGGQAEVGVFLPEFVVEPDVRVVEEQQVLALDREHQRLGVDGSAAEHAGGKDGVQQEQCVAGLGGDAGDAADRDVRAAGAVEEVEVDVDGGAVAAGADRQLAVHLVEVQRVLAVGAGRAAGRSPGRGGT